MLPLSGRPACILFDLDGTLLDTAPDMAFAINQLLTEQNHAALPFAHIRPHVSHGSRALLEIGFGLYPEDAGYEPLKLRFLDIYRANLAAQTVLFPGMESILAFLEQRSIPWGIVTNKPSWLTDPLLEILDLTTRSACVISSDTTAYAKPHPEPLFYACRQIGVAPEHCIYIGDAQRDIEAGRAAGMATIAVRYGYIAEHESPEHWGADGLIDSPEQLLIWLKNSHASS